MIIAIIVHVADNGGFGDYSHALELGILFAGLFFTGPGKYVVKQ